MEKLRPSVFWLKGSKSRHQFRINRENKIKMVPIPAAIMEGLGHTDIKTTNYCVSSTSLIFLASLVGPNGFCKNGVLAINTNESCIALAL
jgi:hypothetical protein